MTNNHITEELLQAYLLENKQNEAVAVHLSKCTVCREKLENYQHLLDTIQKIPTETFAFDVTALVMDTVISYETKKSKKKNFVFWTMFTSCCLGLLALAIPFLPHIISFFNALADFYAIFSIGIGVMVVLFLAVDLYKQYLWKEKLFFGKNLQPTH